MTTRRRKFWVLKNLRRGLGPLTARALGLGVPGFGLGSLQYLEAIRDALGGFATSTSFRPILASGASPYGGPNGALFNVAAFTPPGNPPASRTPSIGRAAPSPAPRDTASEPADHSHLPAFLLRPVRARV